MPLFNDIFDTDLQSHLRDTKARTILNLYLATRENAAERTVCGLPHLLEIAAHDTMGLGGWTIRVAERAPGIFIYEHFGHKVEQMLGFSMLGRQISSELGRPYDFFLDCYRRIARDLEPLVTHSTAVLSPRVGSWVRLLLPCRDDANGLHILGILTPISTEESMVDSLLQSVGEPGLVIQIVRNADAAAIDARILRLNDAARRLLRVSSARHLHLSDVLPQIALATLTQTIERSHATGAPARYVHPFTVCGQPYDGLEATRCGDGAVLVFRQRAAGGLEAQRQPRDAA